MLVDEIPPHLPIRDGPENSSSQNSELIKNTSCGVLSTPNVRGLAKDYGIDVAGIHGTGKDGRVLKEDVLRYAVEKGILEENTASKRVTGKVLFVEEAKCKPSEAFNFGSVSRDETITLR